jgi:hypothetical protein
MSTDTTETHNAYLAEVHDAFVRVEHTAGAWSKALAALTDAEVRVNRISAKVRMLDELVADADARAEWGEDAPYSELAAARRFYRAEERLAVQDEAQCAEHVEMLADDLAIAEQAYLRLTGERYEHAPF